MPGNDICELCTGRRARERRSRTARLITVADLDNIQGPLTFQWAKGIKLLTVDDKSAATDDVYQLSNERRLPQCNAPALPPLLLWRPDDILFFAGQVHANTVNVNRVAAGVLAAIFAGQGQNQVVVTPLENLNAIRDRSKSSATARHN